MINRLFLSVGAMKAGTTWLYEQLRHHPEIFFTPEKEVHYFANVGGIENQLNHRKRLLKLKAVLEKFGKGNPVFIAENIEVIDWYVNYAGAKQIDDEWYQNLYKNAGSRVCSDFSNLYCQMELDGWERVRKVAKNIKVIYTLRNPIDRIWSHYKFHLKWIGKETEVLDLGVEEFENIIDKKYFWVNAQYAKNYSGLKSALSEDELMLLYFDDFRRSPDLMLSRICEFLEIDGAHREGVDLDKKINKTKDYVMPESWRTIAMARLQPEIDEMKDMGLWRKEWTD